MQTNSNHLYCFEKKVAISSNQFYLQSSNSMWNTKAKTNAECLIWTINDEKRKKVMLEQLNFIKILFLDIQSIGP